MVRIFFPFIRDSTADLIELTRGKEKPKTGHRETLLWEI